MQTLENAWDIVEGLNNDAHDSAWDTWVEADRLADQGEDDDDWVRAEELREEASLEQAQYFREAWDDLNDQDRQVVEHWIRQDSDLRDQFAVYYGEQECQEQWPDLFSDN